MEEIDPLDILTLQNKIIKDELDDLLAHKQITEDEYSRDITRLAYEFGIAGYIDDCLLMLLNIKNDYFNVAGIKDFENDPTFFAKCYVLFEILSYANLVPYDIMTTQKEGKA